MNAKNLIIFGILTPPALQGYFWVRAGETWKAVLLGIGIASVLGLAGWAWHRWKKSRNRVYDPALIKEKTSRVAFEAGFEVTAVLPPDGREERARKLLDNVAAAYRHYDNAAGARFRVGKVRPAVPDAGVNPPSRGLLQSRNVLGVREAATLWHPPGPGDDMPLVERSGSKVLLPSARGVKEGALVGAATGGAGREIRFSADLMRRHHLYVARTRMGKSTLMQHVVVHKMREKAAGRDDDAIIVVDPHADLVKSLLRHVPASIIDRVRLIDLADKKRTPGINLLDTAVFSDRDRTADSVVRICKGLWVQWGPRMLSILEHTVKTLHEVNDGTSVDRGRQYTILDGSRLLSEKEFRDDVLRRVHDPYILRWWAEEFGKWPRHLEADALAPVQTRLAYYSSSKRARAVLGQPRSTIDLRQVIADGGILFVSTAQGDVGKDVSSLVGASLMKPHRRRHTGAGQPAAREAQGRDLGGRRDAGDDRGGLRVDARRAGEVRSIPLPGDPGPRQAGRPLADAAGHPALQRGVLGRLPGGGGGREAPCLGAGQGPDIGGRCHLPAGASLLRAGDGRRGASSGLLDGRESAREGKAGGCRAHRGRDRRLHRIAGGDGRQGGGGRAAGGAVQGGAGGPEG